MQNKSVLVKIQSLTKKLNLKIAVVGIPGFSLVGPSCVVNSGQTQLFANALQHANSTQNLDRLLTGRNLIRSAGTFWLLLMFIKSMSQQGPSGFVTSKVTPFITIGIHFLKVLKKLKMLQ